MVMHPRYGRAEVRRRMNGDPAAFVRLEMANGHKFLDKRAFGHSYRELHEVRV